MSIENDDWFQWSAFVRWPEIDFRGEYIKDEDEGRLEVITTDDTEGGYSYFSSEIIKTRAQFDRYIKYLYELAEKARFDD